MKVTKFRPSEECGFSQGHKMPVEWECNLGVRLEHAMEVMRINSLLWKHLDRNLSTFTLKNQLRGKYKDLRITFVGLFQLFGARLLSPKILSRKYQWPDIAIWMTKLVFVRALVFWRLLQGRIPSCAYRTVGFIVQGQPRQATGPPRSDGRVGIGGLGIPYLKIKEV